VKIIFYYTDGRPYRMTAATIEVKDAKAKETKKK